MDRRAFLGSLAAMLPAAAHGKDAPPKEAHAVPSPPDLELSTVTLEAHKMYGRPSPAVVALPKVRPAGALFPLLVLLPGGEHTMQRREHGCWGWWSDFKLGDTEAALRRGAVTADELGGFATEEQRATLNARLSRRPWRGMVIVTPFVVRRQTELGPHGAMVTPFLRGLVEWARKELPVLPDRASTGLGGISASGAWVLFSGPQLADLFGALVAVQPFTDGYEKAIRKMLATRSAPQAMRLITSLGDRLHAPAMKLVEQLAAEGIAVEHAAYAGPHAPSFAAGVGGVEMLLSMEERLARPQVVTSRPALSASASASTAPSASSSAVIAPAAPPPGPSGLGLKIAAIAGAAGLAGGAIALRRARR